MPHIQLHFSFSFMFESALLILWAVYSLHVDRLCSQYVVLALYSQWQLSLDCFHTFPVVIFIVFSTLFFKLGTSFEVALGSLIYPLSDPFSGLTSTITFERIKLSRGTVVY